MEQCEAFNLTDELLKEYGWTKIPVCRCPIPSADSHPGFKFFSVSSFDQFSLLIVYFYCRDKEIAFRGRYFLLERICYYQTSDLLKQITFEQFMQEKEKYDKNPESTHYPFENDFWSRSN